MRFADVVNGVVVNLVEASGPDVLPGHLLVLAHDQVGIGWTWDGAQFTQPAPQAPAVPASVTRRQAKQALFLAGKLTAIESTIAGMADPAKTLADIYWQDSQTFDREHPMIADLGAAVGLSSGDIDDLFRAAEKL